MLAESSATTSRMHGKDMIFSKNNARLVTPLSMAQQKLFTCEMFASKPILHALPTTVTCPATPTHARGVIYVLLQKGHGTSPAIQLINPNYETN
jgi:hypothetical protein